MSEKTKIEWCDDTWNFSIGCSKVSPGCQFCYAEVSTPVRVARAQGTELWGPGSTRKRASDATFNAPLRWNEKPWVCDICGNASGPEAPRYNSERICVKPGCASMSFHRRRVFSLSLGDWLDKAIPIEVLADALDVIRRCPNLNFLLLTKRPENWRERLIGEDNEDGEEGGIFKHFMCSGNSSIPGTRGWEMLRWIGEWIAGTPPHNIWIGATVENQEYAGRRIPELLKIPAKVRFISYEPALGEVDFSEWLWRLGCEPHCGDKCSRDADCDINPSNSIHWIIVGGESGSDARPFNVEWARQTIAQCKAAGTACFVKQMGAFPRFGRDESEKFLRDKKGGDMAEWPSDLRVREFPKVEAAK